MKKSLRVKDLFTDLLRSEVSLVNYFSNPKDVYPYQFILVERVNSRHYHLYVKKYRSEFPCRNCRVSANMLVSDLINYLCKL